MQSHLEISKESPSPAFRSVLFGKGPRVAHGFFDRLVQEVQPILIEHLTQTDYAVPLVGLQVSF